jgi:hypothetical protein
MAYTCTGTKYSPSFSATLFWPSFQYLQEKYSTTRIYLQQSTVFQLPGDPSTRIYLQRSVARRFYHQDLSTLLSTVFQLPGDPTTRIYLQLSNVSCQASLPPGFIYNCPMSVARRFYHQDLSTLLSTVFQLPGDPTTRIYLQLSNVFHDPVARRSYN